MALESIGLVKVDGVHLRRVFCRILDVISKEFAKTAEFGLSSVFEAEIEGLMSGTLVHDFQASVVLQYFQDSAIRFPQELEPWRDDGAVCPIFGLFSRYSGKEDSFRGFGGLEIFNVEVCRSCGILKAGLNLIGLRLRVLYFLFGEFDKFLQNQLQKLASACIHPKFRS